MRYKYLRFPGGKPKAVTFSYDDGCPQDKRFSETLTQYGLKGTFNLNGYGFKGTTGLSPEEVKEYLVDKGHEIAVHGYSHRASGAQRLVEGIKDVLDNRLELEELFGGIVRGMAYPDSGITRMANGTKYEDAKQYLTELDIAYSRTLGGDNDKFELPADWHAWMPTAHHNNPQILDWIQKFIDFETNPQNGYRKTWPPMLFYIWGHSYEFDRNDNWDLLTEICEKISGNDQVWYATNIEIFDYVQGYMNLKWSANGARVYNPNLFTVWFDVDGTTYSVAPGETIDIA